MIEYCKIRSVFIPVYADEDEGIIESWKELTVAYVDVLPTFVLTPNGDMEQMQNICLACFDKKASDKIMIKLFVEVDEFRIGKYEINEFRRGGFANKKRDQAGRSGNNTADSISNKNV